MKPKAIIFDRAFERRFKKYIAGLSGAQRDRFKQKMKLLKEDIFAPGLKTHKLKGNLSEYYAISISYSERLVFKILEDGSVYLIEIGPHDICY
jgi:mRNA-degrading endonuclease YafQ of YafQ-DinJ toxin-antitoxin module